jgi:hypothetical protein
MAYHAGCGAKDPCEFWYQDEIDFFDYHIIPLAKKLKDCGVLGVSSGENLQYAEKYRKEWEEKGEHASNLQRQIIHGTASIGISKCASAAQRLYDINPLVQVRVYEMEFTRATALAILREGFSEGVPYGVVVDGSDNFPTKYLIK